MAQQIINNGETGLAVRTKLNANFTELYTGKDAVTVNSFADLPAPGTVTGQRYWVLTSTGVFLVNRRSKGAYYSDGAAWSYLGDNPTTADQIGNVPAGGIAATNVQAALNELDGDKEVAGAAAAAIATHVGLPDPHVQYVPYSELSESIDNRVAALLVAGANVTLTYNDAAGTLTIAAAGGGGGGLSIGRAMSISNNQFLN